MHPAPSHLQHPTPPPPHPALDQWPKEHCNSEDASFSLAVSPPPSFCCSRSPSYSTPFRVPFTHSQLEALRKGWDKLIHASMLLCKKKKNTLNERCNIQTMDSWLPGHGHGKYFWFRKQDASNKMFPRHFQARCFQHPRVPE